MTNATAQELTFRYAPDAMLLFDGEGDILGCNEAAEVLFGLPASEVTGKNLGLFGPSEGYDFRPGIRGLVEAGFNNGDVRMTRGNGEVIDAEYRSRANVSPGVHLTIIRDASGSKRTEASLRASEQLFARSLIAAPAAITVTTVSSKSCLLANEQFLILSGYWRSEVIGSDIPVAKLWAEPGARSQALERLQSASTCAPFPALFRRRDGAGVAVLAALALSEVNGQACEIMIALAREPAAKQTVLASPSRG